MLQRLHGVTSSAYIELDKHRSLKRLEVLTIVSLSAHYKYSVTFLVLLEKIQQRREYATMITQVYTC